MSVDINIEALSNELKLEGNKLFAGLNGCGFVLRRESIQRGVREVHRSYKHLPYGNPLWFCFLQSS